MKNIHSMRFRLMSLMLVLFGASAHAMFQPIFKAGAKIVGISGLCGASSLASVMGYEHYKTMQAESASMPSLPAFIPHQVDVPVSNQVSLPVTPVTTVQQVSKVSSATTVQQCFNGTCSLLGSTVKFVSTAALNFAVQNPQVALALGTAALGAVSYFAKNAWDMYVVKKGIKGLDGKLDAATKDLKQKLETLETDLKAAIEAGNSEVQVNLTVEITKVKTELAEKLESLNKTVSELSSRTTQFHGETTRALAELKTGQKEILDAVRTSKAFANKFSTVAHVSNLFSRGNRFGCTDAYTTPPQQKLAN